MNRPYGNLSNGHQTGNGLPAVWTGTLKGKGIRAMGARLAFPPSGFQRANGRTR
jgi:hypothetical protein